MSNRITLLIHVGVKIGSEAACSAALRQALDNYGVFDTDALQAVLETDATGFARALCTSLQQTPSDRSTERFIDRDNGRCRRVDARWWRRACRPV
jgi:hypothetical protein